MTGASPDAVVLREMLIGGALIELGCGFNPKWPRHQIYPAGSNSPGALHFGIDLTKPSDYIKKVMPNWEEPPVHMDIVTFDSTVDAGSGRLVTDGFLEALARSGRSCRWRRATAIRSTCWKAGRIDLVRRAAAISRGCSQAARCTPRDCVDAVESSFREQGEGNVGVLPRAILTADGAPPAAALARAQAVRVVHARLAR